MTLSNIESEKRRPEEPEMPRELQMDLLVDEELPEDRRRALLLSLNREVGGAGWRELSLRFLQRQVERRSVRDFVSGIRLTPVEENATVYKFPWGSWLGSSRVAMVAAGLMIAVGSALVTGYWAQERADTEKNVSIAANGTRSLEMMKTNLPGSVMGTTEAVPVEFPVVTDGKPPVFPAVDTGTSRRRELIIQPDGPGKAMLIPVNTLPMNVY